MLDCQLTTDTKDDVELPPTALRKFLQATVLKKKWTRIEALTSIGLYLHVLPWGIYCGALSTTLLDLEQLNQCTTTQIGLIFTAITFGALFGAPSGGLVLSKVDCRIHLGIVCCVYGCTTISLPWAGNFVTFVVIAVIHGFFQGALDSGQNVTALLIWGWDGTMFLQAFHGMFAIGTFIGPWLTKPFLAPTWYERMPRNNSTMDNTTETVNATLNTTAEDKYVLVSGESRVYISYLMIGAYFIACGILYFVIFFVTRKDRKREANKGIGDRKQRTMSTVDRYRNPNQSKLWYMLPMAIMAFIRFATYVGLELTFSGFLMTFLVKGLGWEKKQGLTATTVYWGSFAGSRMVAIFLVLFLSPTTMGVADIILMLVAYIVMAIFVTHHSVIITLCSIVAGIGQASFYGCSMSWAYRYMNVSERVGTIFTTGAWAGMAAIPALAAYLIDSVTAVAFIYMCLGLVIVLSTSTLIATGLGLKCGTELPNTDETAATAKMTS